MALTGGEGSISGRPLGRGSTAVGYVPQRIAIDAATMIKARDVVRLGLDGHRWGVPIAFGARRRAAGTGSTSCSDRSARTASPTPRCPCCPAGSCSESGWPRPWPADPALLLCDEPLAALDLRHQQDIAALIDGQRRSRRTAVLFVTHDINPVLPYVDQVLYLAGGSFRLGPPDRVLTSKGLSELYGAPVDVLPCRAGSSWCRPRRPASHQSHDDHAATEVGAWLTAVEAGER